MIFFWAAVVGVAEAVGEALAVGVAVGVGVGVGEGVGAGTSAFKITFGEEKWNPFAENEIYPFSRVTAVLIAVTVPSS